MGQEAAYDFINDGVRIIGRDEAMAEMPLPELDDEAQRLITEARELSEAVNLALPHEMSPTAYTRTLGRLATTAWGPSEYAVVNPSLAGASDEAAAQACRHLERFSGHNCLGFVFVEPPCPDAAPPQHFETVQHKMRELSLVVAYVEPQLPPVESHLEPVTAGPTLQQSVVQLVGSLQRGELHLL